MKVIVQKFGGSSLRDDVGRQKATEHISQAVSNQYKVVVVVSAMGRNGDPYATDSLLALISDMETTVTNRERDLLLSCGEIISAVVMSHLLNKAGIKTVALTGGQAGFRTTENYGDARIIDMKCERLIHELTQHDVVVVAGFQGIAKNGEVTTLGRGGSDTSAAALGVALNAEWIDIFTDVEGMMTADPRIVEGAKPLSVVHYNEASNMAYQGAKVIHPRAVEVAMQAKIPMRIRSTYSNSPGTLVTAKEHHVLVQEVNDRLITGITYVNNITQIKVVQKKELDDLHSKVFKAMAEHRISVDFINISPKNVVYTVPDHLTETAVDVLTKMGLEPEVERHCAKVAVVGAGMAGVPGVTAKIVAPLAEKGIQILQSADSHSTIWVLVRQKDLELAVNILHSIFQLDKDHSILA